MMLLKRKILERESREILMKAHNCHQYCTVYTHVKILHTIMEIKFACTIFRLKWNHNFKWECQFIVEIV